MSLTYLLVFIINITLSLGPVVRSRLSLRSAPPPSSPLCDNRDLAGTCPATTEDCIPGNKWWPNSPLFFLHHAMIGKIWSDWQNLNETSATAFAGGSVQAFDNTTYFAEYPTRAPPMLNTSSDIYMDNMFPGATIGDVSNHTAGYLCYVYE
ncbi:hypothetical protein J3R30DRAFT_3733296 [Lentinula aciculospora]|uniref:Tyrosinase copper-binding domain-containing protein n=1 Tax=Lentinula aciculospora TaxID=153920 RepID=A0A9W9DPS7_9AGAR|nr:hypothetical protein J3R30DRAFT_3733296 [Lentinula aciculospora]